LDEPNKLSVVFENGNTGNYNVWDTDYVTYALVYSCKQLPSVLGIQLKQENAWILAREKSLDESIVNNLRAKLEENHIDLGQLAQVDQNC
jgi:hypothetical protein